MKSVKMKWYNFKFKDGKNYTIIPEWAEDKHHALKQAIFEYIIKYGGNYDNVTMC